MEAMRELTWGRGQILLGDKQIGSFETMTFRERATVSFETEHWEYAKEFGGTVVAARTEGEPRRMSADKGGLFFTYWDVCTPTATYRLKGSRVSVAGAAIGQYDQRGIVRYLASVTVPETVPMCDHVFLLWVVTVDERRRRARSHAAGDTG
ncbi:hypothetical protein [Allobranchiibius huperziae]|uniref:Uncharacterized protein n=1 Tax=Allobranchiibius huperziae TaxID=1874116 RepID=A0A853DBZ1_9MICO|nr:hypothetical protein [Allobranchiibius huperziae]NYJ73499.1 hypothetical protein [Allobranchiibius huperziae]